MRTILAPGVEITEHDRSSYATSMTGTGCYVMGFANKGELYTVNQFTSKSAWLAYYGEPTNEAEKYFYNAAIEVLNEGGQLYCSRLPYANDATNKVVVSEFSVGNYSSDYVLNSITSADSSIVSAALISPTSGPTCKDLSVIDSYKTGERKVQTNRIIIADKTCSTYKNAMALNAKKANREILGIMPIITTAANAIYAQRYLDSIVDETSAYLFECISGVTTLSDITSSVSATLNSSDLVRPLNSKDCFNDISVNAVSSITYKDELIGESYAESLLNISEQIGLNVTAFNIISNDNNEPSAIAYTAISSVANPVKTLPNTVSFEANEFFPAIQFDIDDEKTTQRFDRTHLKKVGIIVYQMYCDSSNNNKIAFEPVEAFIGSLDRTARDPVTGASIFIDKIVNSNSNYIDVYSNVNVDFSAYKNADILIAGQTAQVLGFPTNMMKKTIKLTDSIYQGMNRCFELAKNINDYQIDVVVDAGIANIASFINTMFGVDGGEYDLFAVNSDGIAFANNWKCNGTNIATKTWKAVEQMFDNFCKNIRKDCMFIADGLRPLVLTGNTKIIRSTAPENTIDKSILPNIKWITGLNTSYGAGYIDWFEVADDYSGDSIWLPPSIKAAGIYINTDINHNYWDAPAGLNRGIVSAVDVAFSPTLAEAGQIYNKCWNYAVKYLQDGIVLEGQKTFQSAATAFDRVNVRRLFLRLERMTFQVAKYFVYEGNTAYTRQRLIDTLDPIFKAARIGGGIYDYQIVCDESINTPNVIDNNELRVQVKIKPTKTIEFLLVDFYATSTAGSFNEIR